MSNKKHDAAWERQFVAQFTTPGPSRDLLAKVSLQNRRLLAETAMPIEIRRLPARADFYRTIGLVSLLALVTAPLVLFLSYLYWVALQTLLAMVFPAPVVQLVVAMTAIAITGLVILGYGSIPLYTAYEIKLGYNDMM